MLFQVWDNEKKRLITPQSNLEELAKEVDLPVPMDVDGIYVGMDGALVLLDECGNSVHLDSRRFRVLWDEPQKHTPKCTVIPVREKAEKYAPLIEKGTLLKKVPYNP